MEYKIISHLEKYVGSKVSLTKHFKDEKTKMEFDLAFFHANRGRPYHIVATVGISKYKMMGKSKRAEFILYLDKNWNLFSEDEQYSWVYKMMAEVASGFYVSGREVGYGQTYVSLGANTFSPVTEMNSAILYYPVGLDNDSWKLKVSFSKKVDFYLLTTATYREYAIVRKIGGLSFVNNYLLEDGDLNNLVVFNKKHKN